MIRFIAFLFAFIPAVSFGSGLVSTKYTSVYQSVMARSASMVTGTTIIPIDGSAPSILQGDEYLSATITPHFINTWLVITAHIRGASDTGTLAYTCAIFVDGYAGALQGAATKHLSADNVPDTLTFFARMPNLDLKPKTFRVRCGPPSAATFTLNGPAMYALGGFGFSWMTIEESAM